MYYFTASFNNLPGLNEGTLVAAIANGSPVWGLRPVRAALSRTSNLPNPTKVKDSPLAKVDSTTSVNADKTRSASTFLTPAFSDK